MTGKLAFAIGGFLLGAATMFVLTETLRRERLEPVRVNRPGPPATTNPEEMRPAAATLRPAPKDLAETYLRRIDAAKADGDVRWIVEELFALEPEQSRDLIVSIYGRIQNPRRRSSMVW